MSEVRAQRRAELDAPRIDTRSAILHALEEVLAEHPLHTVSVAQIIEVAGVSRGAFYSYFESKFDAAGALITQVIDRGLEIWQPFIEQPESDPLAGLASALRASLDMWAEHRGIALTYHQYWNTVPELGQQWLANFDRFVARLADSIDQARADGTLPAGADSRKLAAAGMWMTEQLISVAITGADEKLSDREFVIEMLVNMWQGLLFGDGRSG
ncbi:MAG TPA: TetR/AcrR family transcriptional regulator [Pseudonocardia sp.]